MISPAEARRLTGGCWVRPPAEPERLLRGAAFDTRRLGDAQMFFALRGEGGDGHRFLHHLAGSGVRLAVVERPEAPPGFAGAVLQVPDALAALQRLGTAALERQRPRVVAVTGSYGKTTAKELIAHVLGGARRVRATPGSYNNEIGVPVTLLALDGSEEVAVLEFAARKPGDIGHLGRIAPPDVAVLLNVGRAHVGVLGSVEHTYRTKGEIFRHLRPGGLAVAGAEDPRLAALAREHGASRVVTFGHGVGDYRAEGVTTDALGRQTFTGVQGDICLPLRSGLTGAHGLYPLLAAWAVAREVGVDDAVVAARGARPPVQKGRSVLARGPGGATVIDDTYNASPETVVNLVDTLARLDAPEKVLVLGHLSELEEGLADSAPAIGAALRPPLGRLWVHDPGRPETVEQFRALARGPEVRYFPTQPELIAALRELDRPGVAIGVKGARSAHMERAVEGLMGTAVACRRAPCALLMHCTECDRLSEG